jgi:hypothetical protein
MAATLDLRQYSEKFEHLAHELLTRCFNVMPSKKEVTRSSHDGGVDGIWQVAIASALGVEHHSVMEAKLRGESSLRLEVIGKSVIVAFNIAASTLFVVTNCKFSPQAFHHLNTFQQKTNLRIRMIDGKTLASWIVSARKSLRKYPSELLDFLVAAGATQSVTKETGKQPADLAISSEYVVTSVPASGYEIEFGWDGEKIANCELRSLGDGMAEAPPTLIGKVRRERMESLIRELESAPGIALVTGAAGVGKSLVVAHARHRLAEAGFVTTMINLDRVTSKRALFTRILSALTATSVEAIVAASGVEGVEALVAWAGGKPT